MLPHNHHNFADADINVQRPITSSALSGRAIGEHTSEACWALLTAPPPLAGAAAPTASHLKYRTMPICKSRSNFRTLGWKGGSYDGCLPTLFNQVDEPYVPMVSSTLVTSWKYTIKLPLFVAFTQLFCILLCQRAGNKSSVDKSLCSLPRLKFTDQLVLL